MSSSIAVAEERARPQVVRVVPTLISTTVTPGVWTISKVFVHARVLAC